MKQSTCCEAAAGLRAGGRSVGIALGAVLLSLAQIAPWSVGVAGEDLGLVSLDRFASPLKPLIVAAAGAVERSPNAAEFRPQYGQDRTWDEPRFRPQSADSNAIFRPRTDDARRAGGSGAAQPYRDASRSAAFDGGGDPYREHELDAQVTRRYPSTLGFAAPSAYAPSGHCAPSWPPGAARPASAPVNPSCLSPLLAMDIPPPWMWTY